MEVKVSDRQQPGVFWCSLAILGILSIMLRPGQIPFLKTVLLSLPWRDHLRCLGEFVEVCDKCKEIPHLVLGRLAVFMLLKLGLHQLVEFLFVWTSKAKRDGQGGPGVLSLDGTGQLDIGQHGEEAVLALVIQGNQPSGSPWRGSWDIMALTSSVTCFLVLLLVARLPRAYCPS